MCLDVLGYAPLHGVHTHCPCSKRLVFRAFIELRATAVLLSQLPPTYSLIHSLHHRTTLHALHAGANRCTTVGNARGNACKSHRRLFTRRSGHTVPFALDAAAARASAPGTRFLSPVFAW